MQTAMHAVFSTIVDGYRQQRENTAYDSTEAVKQLKMKLSWLKMALISSKKEEKLVD